MVTGVVGEDVYGRRKEWERDEGAIRAEEAVTRPD